MDMVKEVGNGRSVIDVCGEYEMKPSAFYARKNYMKKAGKFQKNDGDDEDKIARIILKDWQEGRIKK